MVAEMGFQFDPTRPIYLQIMEQIKKRAVRGQYGAGSQLPSVREMAGKMGVNPNTAARAYMELEREGFTFTRRGQGSFVTEAGDRIEAERRALADAAVGRFVSEIREMELSADQVAGLMDGLGEALRR